MNFLPQPLGVLISVRIELRLGKSLPAALENICSENEDALMRSLKTWLIRIQSGQVPSHILSSLPELTKTAAIRSFVCVLERGINGSPIDGALGELEEEFFSLAQQVYERRLQLLPINLLIPLTLLILPGTMFLILGPVIFRLFYGV